MMISSVRLEAISTKCLVLEVMACLKVVRTKKRIGLNPWSSMKGLLL